MKIYNNFQLIYFSKTWKDSFIFRREKKNMKISSTISFKTEHLSRNVYKRIFNEILIFFIHYNSNNTKRPLKKNPPNKNQSKKKTTHYQTKKTRTLKKNNNPPPSNWAPAFHNMCDFSAKIREKHVHSAYYAGDNPPRGRKTGKSWLRKNISRHSKTFPRKSGPNYDQGITYTKTSHTRTPPRNVCVCF